MLQLFSFVSMDVSMNTLHFPVINHFVVCHLCAGSEGMVTQRHVEDIGITNLYPPREND